MNRVASKVLILGGKGGVGRSTVGACLSIQAARNGYDVLLLQMEHVSPLAGLLGIDQQPGYQRLTAERYRSSNHSGKLTLRRLIAEDALAEYLEQQPVGRLLKSFDNSGIVDVVTAAVPGVRDLIVLSKIRQLTQTAVDLIIVDGPASGHLKTMLNTPQAMVATAKLGPIQNQAEQALNMLNDPNHCQLMLVTTPEETVISETVETAYELEDSANIKLAPIMVNAVWPPIAGLRRPAASSNTAKAQAARLRLERVEAQQRCMERLQRQLPLPLLWLPHLFQPTIDQPGLTQLVDHLANQQHELF